MTKREPYRSITKLKVGPNEWTVTWLDTERLVHTIRKRLTYVRACKLVHDLKQGNRIAAKLSN